MDANRKAGSMGSLGKLTLRERMDSDLDGNVSLSEMFCFAGETVLENNLVSLTLTILFLPIVAVFPPLETVGRSSPARVLRCLSAPAALRFWLYCGFKIAFAAFLSLSEFPIHRGEPSPLRDWSVLIMGVADFVKEVELVTAGGINSYTSDPYNSVAFFASLLTVGACSLNVCNYDDWFVVTHLSASSSTINIRSFGDFRTMTELWGRCGVNEAPIVPLAAREIFGVAVALRWFDAIPRLTNRNSTLGPLVLMWRAMARDVLKWVFFLVWAIVTFGFFFFLLFREPYGFMQDANGNPLTALPEDCEYNPDKELVRFWVVVRRLLEAALTMDGQFNCLAHSSTPAIALPAMYLFVMMTSLMLVNMLIAMMTKSFDRVYEQQMLVFLFLKARQTQNWSMYPPAPPPLNVLGLPYRLGVVLVSCPMVLLRTLRGSDTKREARCQKFWLPEWWSDVFNAEELAKRVRTFLMDDREEQTSKIVSALAERSAEQMAEMRTMKEQIASLSVELSACSQLLSRLARPVDPAASAASSEAEGQPPQPPSSAR